MPLWLPVKQQPQSPTGQDVSSNAQGLSAALSFVAEYVLYSKEKRKIITLSPKEMPLILYLPVIHCIMENKP